MNKLNLGCGYVQPDDWVNADKLDYGQKCMTDILRGTPWPDNHFDFVLMNHTLQMFTYEELPVALAEVKRVMKPGATLRILTPNLMAAIEGFYDETRFDFPIADKLEKTTSGKFARYLFWHGDTRCAFDEFSLPDLLMRNGYKECRLGVFGECDLDSREAESLIVECRK